MDLSSVAFVGFLVAAPWPFWHLATSVPVRHRRRDQVALLAALVGYALAVVVVAVVWPAILPVLVAVAGIVVIAFWWRSRPSYGARRGIPPGRIRLHPLGQFTEVDYLSRETERYGPIFKIGATFPVPTMTPIICIVGHDLALELLRQHEGSLEVYPPFPTSRLIPRGFLRTMTVEDHDRYAPVFRKALATAPDAPFEIAVADAARRALASLAADSAANGRGVSPGPCARAFAFDVLARLLFGFEAGSEAHARLAAQIEAIDIEGIARWLPRRSSGERWPETVSMLEAAFSGPDAPAGPSVLGEVLAVARGTDRAPEEAIAEDTIFGNVLQMQISATQDLSDLLIWTIKQLGDHPVWLERARDDPTLADRIVRESLRLEQSEYLFRRMTEDITFHGFRFPKGWRIRICVREAHRSAAVFERPTEFDPDRFLRSVPASDYSPFGLARHRCMGVRLVGTVGRIFVEELARGYDLAVVGDGPREHNRFHWQPSPRLRVRLSPWQPVAPTRPV